MTVDGLIREREIAAYCPAFMAHKLFPNAVPGASAMSCHFDTRTAASEVADLLDRWLDGICDLLLLFGSYHHHAAMSDAVDVLTTRFATGTVLGTTAEGVIETWSEMVDRPALAALAVRLPAPGIRVHPFRIDDLAALPPGGDGAVAVRECMGIEADHRLTLLLADPFSTPLNALAATLGPQPGLDPVCAIGGLASGACLPGHNRLLLGDTSFDRGIVGVTLSGDLRVDTIVAQGCRPIGPQMTATRVDGNFILELDGRSPLEVASEVTAPLELGDGSLMANGVLLGLAPGEAPERFGHGDFLMRSILWTDRSDGAIALNDQPRLGQIVQFHVRDAEAARDDIELRLAAQAPEGQPAAAILVTSKARGRCLFHRSKLDAALIGPHITTVAMAGFHSAGEIAPIHGVPHVHSQNACLALLRLGREAERFHFSSDQYGLL